MLMAPNDKYGVDIDNKEKLYDDVNEEKPRAESQHYSSNQYFYNGCMVEDDSLRDGDVYVDFGDNSREEIDLELYKQVAEVSQNGLSNEGIQRLQESIAKHKKIFQLILGSGGPANVPPMKFQLDPTNQPVHAKVRRYTDLQWKLLDQ